MTFADQTCLLGSLVRCHVGGGHVKVAKENEEHADAEQRQTEAEEKLERIIEEQCL